ncbi:helix-turn-helix domain-containing protein [Streptomyces venezuelae]|uniref:helix-turn-helix domain-containing protein n=1 Tax=Streptomyces venezuelae TaxID=54571 RepID=UPI0037CF59D4
MPGWKALPDELDPDISAFTERLRRLVDRSGLGVSAVAERTGHERAAWDRYLNARQSAPRSAVVALAEVTGSDPAALATDWERADRAWTRAEALAGSRERATPPGAAAPGPVDRRVGDDGPGAHRVGDDGPGPHRVGDDRTMEIRRLDRAPGAAPSPPGPAGPAPRDAAGPEPRGAIGTEPRGAAARAPRRPEASAPAASPRRTVLLYAVGVLGALLVVTAALLLVDLGGSGGGAAPAAAPPVTTAPPTTQRASLPPGVGCSGPDCTGQDPEAMGCGGTLATTVARARVGTARVEVRYSATCAAAWARITGAAPGDTVSVEAGGAARRATVAPGAAAAETDAYTSMLAVDSGTAAKACGTLVSGGRGCTAKP